MKSPACSLAILHLFGAALAPREARAFPLVVVSVPSSCPLLNPSSSSSSCQKIHESFRYTRVLRQQQHARSTSSIGKMGSSWTQREARRKGGGGGSTSSGGNNSGSGGGFGKSKASKYSSGVQSRGSGGVGDDDAVVEAATGSSSSSAVLDKWGLPPPTLEDIFPPLEEGTKLIPAQNEKEYSLKEIQQATQSFIPLALDVCFDVDGAEKKKMAVQPREASSTNVPPMKLRLLHVSPPVLTIDHFFTPQECASIKRVATESSSDKNSASAGGGGGPVQVHSKTFAGALSTRTSTSWFCYYRDVPTLLAKACRVLGLRLEAMEEPQIVRYGPGQEFSFHYDEIPASQLANGGQRLATLLVYLNTVERSGGTIFRDLKDPDGRPLSVRPREGSALLFFPALENGEPDDRTLHRGEKLDPDEEKWIVQMWIHQRDYRAAVPPNNRQEDALEAIRETCTDRG